MSQKLSIRTLIEQEIGQKVSDETPLDELECDSLEFANLLLVLEEESGKDVPFEKAVKLKTVGELAEAYS